jgi:diguanylate cyclase (GGDEF)-like protein/hemerythrin-like metal-binding protein
MKSENQPTPEPLPVGDAMQALDALLRNDLLPLCIVRDGWLTYVNTAFSRVFALGTREPPFRFTDLVVEEDRPTAAERLTAMASGTTPTARFGFHGLRTDGTVRDVEFFGTVAPTAHGSAIAGLVLDVTEQQRTQARLSSLAFSDALTGLANRAQFIDRLRDAFVAAQAAGTRFAVLLGDLDGFKAVNDRHGHEAGDLVLQAVTKRLRGAARANDTVARLGGDEFAMILPSIGTTEHAALVAGRVVRLVQDPIAIDGDTVAIGISVGVALHPAHGEDMDSLVRAADTAMYAAKKGGRGRYAVATRDEVAGDATPLRFIEWNEAAAVGVEEIDRQHQRMAELINELGEQLKAIEPPERLAGTMETLLAFTREHFASEERLLEAHATEHLERHRRAHRRLLDDLASLASGVDQQSMALTMRYLQDWLFVHIEGADRPLGELLNARGIR